MKKALTDLQLLNMSYEQIDGYINKAFNHVTDPYELVLVGALIDKAKQHKDCLERDNLERRCVAKYPTLELEGLGLESDQLETMLQYNAY